VDGGRLAIDLNRGTDAECTSCFCARTAGPIGPQARQRRQAAGAVERKARPTSGRWDPRTARRDRAGRSDRCGGAVGPGAFPAKRALLDRQDLRAQPGGRSCGTRRRARRCRAAGPAGTAGEAGTSSGTGLPGPSGDAGSAGTGGELAFLATMGSTRSPSARGAVIVTGAIVARARALT
jgi:hypothetical protein